MVLRILDLLFPPRPDELLVRNARQEELFGYLQPTAIGTTTALLPYQNPLVKATVREAKFRGNQRAQEMLGLVVSRYLETLQCPYVLVPIPLSRARRRKRGYNQVERIAEYALTTIQNGALDADVLIRTRDTVPQTDLGGDARRTNMRGAFSAQGVIHPSTYYVVLDDVSTTGATLEAALLALQEAGATQVMCLALAH